jgi:hypothetical protein
MKGTLFSADFVKDTEGNLRLLEFNTDTAIIDEEISNINWNSLLSVIETNSISTVEVIYKPTFHKGIVDSLSSSLQNSSVTNFVYHDEDVNTIYPTSIEDSSDKFILRIAYDESAIFDSTYCKNRLETFRLFTDSNSGSLVSPFFYSSSDDFINTLDYTLNPSNIPDLVIKDIDEKQNPLSFYKIGSEIEGETEEDRWNQFIELNKSDDKLIEQYIYNSNELNDGKITSIRSFNVVYGSELDVINLHSYKVSSIFSLPTDISSEINNSSYVNKLDIHHYYEYTTNFIKADSTGILSSQKVLMNDDTYKLISDIEVGDYIKSYYISGSPQLETDLEVLSWSSEGKPLPTESYLTSSIVVFKNTDSLKYGATIEYVVNGDSLFSGINKKYLVYDTGSNITTFKHASQVEPSTDYFYDLNANLIDIDEVNFYVTSNSSLSMVTLDVEDTDTYIISGSTAFNGLITHNAPCFVAGTKISLFGGGYKNVEDVKVDDIVLSYNFEEGLVQPQKVKGIGSKEVQATVIYTFEDDTQLRCTLDHPLYSQQHGWVSKSPEYTLGKYGLTTKETEVGFKIQKQSGVEVDIKSIEIIDEPTVVYNVNTVENNHNFFANEFLVHNRACFVSGTEITLENGDVKNIEDIIVGDIVLTFNESSEEVEGKLVYEILTPIHSDLVTIELEDGTKITSTTDHPYYTNDLQLKSYDSEKTNELYKLPTIVSDLKVGDVLRKGEYGSEIVNIQIHDKDETQTYLLRVEDNHNYFANGILVHNK